MNSSFKQHSFGSTLLILFFLSLISTQIFAESEGKFLGGADTEYPTWFKNSFLDLSEDVEEATELNKRLMVIFYQDGCPYCNALIERNFSQKDIYDMTRLNFDVVAINIWGDRELIDIDGKVYSEKTYAESKRIQFTPTVFFYNEDKKIILRINGYHKPKRFSLELDYVANHQESKISYRDYMIKNVRRLKQQSSQQYLSYAPNGLIKNDAFRVNVTDYSKAKKDRNKPFAVLFEQKDCPNCINLHTKVLQDNDLKALLKNFDVSQLDTWSNKKIITPNGKQMSIRDWADSIDIQYTPSIVIFNNAGDEIIRSEAFFKVFHTQGMFEYVRSGEYITEPNFQRFLTKYADQIREKGRDVNLWKDAEEANHYENKGKTHGYD